MADTKISALAAVASVADAQEFAVNRGGEELSVVPRLSLRVSEPVV